MDFTPTRLVRSYVQHIVAAPARVLPLLTPDGELLWARGWDPELRWTPRRGRVGTVFVTGGNTTWIQLRYDEAAHVVRYVRVTPDAVTCTLEVALTAEAGGCAARVTYDWVTIGPAGAAVLEQFSEASWTQMMREWEAELNHYLRSGTMLPADAQV